MEFTSCNICGSANYKEICEIEISPHLTSSKLVRCKKCGLFYANPRLNREAEEDYYKHQHYQEDHSEKQWYKGRIATFRRSFHKIEKFLKKGRLVDVGSGMGYFMDLARNNGWEVKGVEISDYAINHAREELKLDIIKGDLESAHFDMGYFDAATMWNVVDQLYDPKANLIELNRILKEGGYLFMRIPNLYFHLRLFRLYNRLRPLFRSIKNSPSVFHLYSFEKKSIKRLLESVGFSNVIVKIEPMDVNVPNFVEVFGRKREGAVRKLLDAGVKAVYLLSLGKIIISPSIFVIAKKGKSLER